MDGELDVRPTLFVTATLAALTTPIIGLGFAALAFSDKPLYGVILVIGGSLLPLSTAGLRYRVVSGDLEKRSFFVRRYRRPLKELSVTDGMAGDFAMHNALLISDAKTNRVIDKVLMIQFRRGDIEILRSSIIAATQA